MDSMAVTGGEQSGMAVSLEGRGWNGGLVIPCPGSILLHASRMNPGGGGPWRSQEGSLQQALGFTTMP